MIKSKMLTSYYGRKAYADGFYGRIREFRVIENADGFREEYALDIGEDKLMDFERVVVMEKLHFLTKNNVIVAIAVVDGRTYVGSAVLNPNDKLKSTMLGRRLALARALQDPDGERVVRFRIHLEELDSVSDGNDDLDEETEDFDEDEDSDEDSGLIGECAYCGTPIYDCDNYVEDADGCLYCNEECLEEEKNELAEEETDEMEQELAEDETEEMEKELAEEN